MTKKPLVSVVIPTKNAGEYLYSCLKSVVGQSYKNIEVIIVDNFSKDITLKTALKFSNKVFTKGGERAAQTNFGIQKAKGVFIYRIDGDFRLEKNVVEEAVEKCQKYNLQGVAVHNTSDPTISFWSKVRKFERDMYKNDDLIVGVRFFLKKSWEEIGGYDENIIWDDYDFHNRFIQKFKWSRINSQEYHLGEPNSLKEIFMKSFFYGKNVLPYLKQHPDRGFRQINPIRLSFLTNWNKFLKSPILTIGFLIMMFVKYTAGMLGFVFAILFRQNG